MGVLALEELIRQRAEIVGVVARWDDPSPDAWYPSVTDCAASHGLSVLRPREINDPQFVEQARQLAPDVMLTAFYPKIYRRPLLEVAPRGSLNLHFAPLPRYRGSYPGAWAIINGETRHGVTLHRMAPGVDNGDVVAQQMVDVTEHDTGATLYQRCEQAGLELLRRTWPTLQNGPITGQPQDETQALYYDRNYPLGGVVNFGWTARHVVDYIRAMTFPPFPNPFTFSRGRKLTIDAARIGEGASGGVCGRVLDVGPTLRVQAADGCVELTALRDERGRPIDLAEAVERYGLAVGAVLGR